MQPLREPLNFIVSLSQPVTPVIAPTSLSQPATPISAPTSPSQPATPVSVPTAPEPVDQISGPATVLTTQSTQQMHYSSPAGATAVITSQAAPAQPKVTTKAAAGIIQTRRQKQDAQEKALQENNALASGSH